jgi:hypothetical protein
MPSKSITAASAKRLAKISRKKKTKGYQPYIGLYKANLKMQEDYIIWEIHNLCENITVGKNS